jgi:hypothetical protein
VKNCGNVHHQAVALQGALVHPELQQIGKSIGYSGEAAQEVKVALFHQEQQKKMIALARKTEKKNARTKWGNQAFIRMKIGLCLIKGLHNCLMQRFLPVAHSLWHYHIYIVHGPSPIVHSACLNGRGAQKIAR